MQTPPNPIETPDMTRRPTRIPAFIRILILALLLPATLHAQPTPPPDPQQAELDAASAEAMRAARPGPADIPLLDQALLHLPRGYAFIPAAQAARLLRAYGNQPDEHLAGAVVAQDDSTWLTTLEWTPAGYVRDNDAADIDPKAILDRIRADTEDGNADRTKRGFPEVTIGQDWVQPPTYDKTMHRLVWALDVLVKGSDQGSVNFYTRILGRDGYFSLDLLDDPRNMDADRPIANTLLAALDYLPGKRYADFDAGTDHVAEFGLAALIGIVAAKKLGLIAIAGVFILKFAKVGLIALAGIGLAARRIFRRTPKA